MAVPVEVGDRDAIDFREARGVVDRRQERAVASAQQNGEIVPVDVGRDHQVGRAVVVEVGDHQLGPGEMPVGYNWPTWKVPIAIAEEHGDGLEFA